MPSEQTRLQLQRLRTRAAQERARATEDHEKQLSLPMHEGAALAYERWADELEKIVETIESIDRTNERVQKQLVDFGLEKIDGGRPTRSDEPVSSDMA
jgi:hypothetical protein